MFITTANSKENKSSLEIVFPLHDGAKLEFDSLVHLGPPPERSTIPRHSRVHVPTHTQSHGNKVLTQQHTFFPRGLKWQVRFI